MRTARISADEAHALRREQLRRVDDALVKEAVAAPASWNPQKRSARFVMTSQAVDRAGDVVMTRGLDTKRFAANSVAFLNHDSRSWPIGSWANLTKWLIADPPRMEGDLVLHAAGGPIPEIDQAAWAIEHGMLRACSIGFLPAWDSVERVLDAKGNWTGGLRFNQAELLECSICGVPMNPDAMAKGARRATVPPRPRPTKAEVDRLKRRLERQVDLDRLRAKWG
jgi:phage head maturation protease